MPWIEHSLTDDDDEDDSDIDDSDIDDDEYDSEEEYDDENDDEDDSDLDDDLNDMYPHPRSGSGGVRYGEEVPSVRRSGDGRTQGGTQQVRITPMPTCLHCSRVLGSAKSMRGRGLCQKCHLCPEIRALYAPDRPCGRSGMENATDAELDALIEEQRKCLPAWWARECEPPEPLPEVRPVRVFVPKRQSFFFR